MTKSRITEKHQLDRIVDQLISEGWTVTTGRKVAELLPRELTFRPDLVAFRGDEKLIGEVVRRGSPRIASVEEMTKLSRQLLDWQVKVFYLDDELPVPDAAEIAEVIEKVVPLSDVSIQAAFVQAWIALEMALRRLEARFVMRPSRRKIPSPVELNSLGVISDPLYEKLTYFQKLRNELLHARPLRDVSQIEISDLVGIVQYISNDDYRTPHEVVQWFGENYTPVEVDDVTSSSMRSSMLLGAESIKRELLSRFPGILDFDAKDVAEFLSGQAEAWVPGRRVNDD